MTSDVALPDWACERMARFLAELDAGCADPATQARWDRMPAEGQALVREMYADVGGAGVLAVADVREVVGMRCAAPGCVAGAWFVRQDRDRVWRALVVRGWARRGDDVLCPGHAGEDRW